MELNDYINIFNKKSTGELSPNRLGDHTIKTNNKNPLYRPLYNLSARELEVLHQYLNKSLEKRWIKSFINPAGVPILFISKKDRNLQLYINY